MNRILIHNWEIIRELGPGYDPIRIQGNFFGHPNNYSSGSPGAFISFDKASGIGVSSRGNTYEFDRMSFKATGFAKTVEEAFDWIERNWMHDECSELR